MTRLNSHARRLLIAAVAAVASVGLLLVNPSSAGATGPGTYVVSRQDGVPFLLLSKGNLLLGSADDSLFRIGTTFSGANHMPFQVHIYGAIYHTMTISSNGNIQFGVCCTGGSAAYSNTQLPSGDFQKSTISVFWDDLFMEPDDTSHPFIEGIFTKTMGVAPHRTFIISWQGHSYNSENYFVLAQAQFPEGAQSFRLVYATRDLQGSFQPSETIGIQAGGGTQAPATQVAFNPSSPGVTFGGRQFTFQHVA